MEFDMAHPPKQNVLFVTVFVLEKRARLAQGLF